MGSSPQCHFGPLNWHTGTAARHGPFSPELPVPPLLLLGNIKGLGTASASSEQPAASLPDLLCSSPPLPFPSPLLSPSPLLFSAPLSGGGCGRMSSATCTQLCLDAPLCVQNSAYSGHALSCTFSVKIRCEKQSCGFDNSPSRMPEFTGGQYLNGIHDMK